MMAPTGCGKTTMLETLACYAVAIEKGNMLLAHQTDADSMTFGETRLLPMLEAIPACRERLPHNRHKVRKAEILFSDMGLYLGGANMSSLQSNPCRYVVLDEAWLLKDSMLREATLATERAAITASAWRAVSNWRSSQNEARDNALSEPKWRTKAEAIDSLPTSRVRCSIPESAVEP
jgi:phage terminase large subunit GpA-like protein